MSITQGSKRTSLNQIQEQAKSRVNWIERERDEADLKKYYMKKQLQVSQESLFQNNQLKINGNSNLSSAQKIIGNNKKKFQSMQTSLNTSQDGLTSQTDFYSKQEFEKILADDSRVKNTYNKVWISYDKLAPKTIFQDKNLANKTQQERKISKENNIFQSNIKKIFQNSQKEKKVTLQVSFQEKEQEKQEVQSSKEKLKQKLKLQLSLIGQQKNQEEFKVEEKKKEQSQVIDQKQNFSPSHNKPEQASQKKGVVSRTEKQKLTWQLLQGKLKDQENQENVEINEKLYREKRKEYFWKKQSQLEQSWKLNQKYFMNKNGPQKIFLSIKQEAFGRGRHDFLKASRFLTIYSQKSIEFCKNFENEYDQSINNSTPKFVVFNIINQFIKNLETQKILFFQLLLYYTLAKLHFFSKDLIETVKNAKQAKRIAERLNLYYLKPKIYRILGKAYIQLRKINMAKYYFIKMLRFAWYLSSNKWELVAYEYIGLINFYKGNLSVAEHYHSKMTNGLLEQDQEIKGLSNSKLQSHIQGGGLDLDSGITDFGGEKQFSGNKKCFQIGDEGIVSSSDDEFNLPEPIILAQNINNFSQLQIDQTQMSQSSLFSGEGEKDYLQKNNNKKIMDWNQRLVRAKINKLQGIINKSDNLNNTNQQHAIFKDKDYYLAQLGKNQQQYQRLNDKIRISHWTPNRLLNNYNDQVDPNFVHSNLFSYKEAFLQEEDHQFQTRFFKILKKLKSHLQEAIPYFEKQVQNDENDFINTDKLSSMSGFQKLQNKVKIHKLQLQNNPLKAFQNTEN